MIEYTILSIDDSREAKKQRIRDTIKDFKEVQVEAINGHVRDNLYNYLRDHDDVGLIDVNIWRPKAGELGVWFSNINAWTHAANSDAEALIVFEDDAMIAPEFDDYVHQCLGEVPDDWDFFALFIPENQKGDFNYYTAFDAGGEHVPGLRQYVPGGSNQWKIKGNKVVARAYQTYSCVAMMYSKQGAQKLLKRVEETTLFTPVDCYLYILAHTDRLNGYQPLPDYDRFVEIDWKAPSLIHKTEGY